MLSPSPKTPRGQVAFSTLVSLVEEAPEKRSDSSSATTAIVVPTRLRCLRALVDAVFPFTLRLEFSDPDAERRFVDTVQREAAPRLVIYDILSTLLTIAAWVAIYVTKPEHNTQDWIMLGLGLPAGVFASVAGFFVSSQHSSYQGREGWARRFAMVVIAKQTVVSISVMLALLARRDDELHGLQLALPQVLMVFICSQETLLVYWHFFSILLQ